MEQLWVSNTGRNNFDEADRCNFFITYRALADVLYIFPLKKDKKTFDANKEELGFATKSKN